MKEIYLNTEDPTEQATLLMWLALKIPLEHAFNQTSWKSIEPQWTRGYISAIRDRGQLATFYADLRFRLPEDC